MQFTDKAAGQAFPIALLATGFFAYSTASTAFFHYLKNHNSKLLVSYYLGERIIRLCLSLAAAVAYVFSGRDSLLLFVINLLAYHLATMLLMGAIQIKTEKAYK